MPLLSDKWRRAVTKNWLKIDKMLTAWKLSFIVQWMRFDTTLMLPMSVAALLWSSTKGTAVLKKLILNELKWLRDVKSVGISQVGREVCCKSAIFIALCPLDANLTQAVAMPAVCDWHKSAKCWKTWLCEICDGKGVVLTSADRESCEGKIFCWFHGLSKVNECQWRGLLMDTAFTTKRTDRTQLQSNTGQRTVTTQGSKIRHFVTFGKPGITMQGKHFDVNSK